MGFANDSSVRSLLNENSEVRMNQAKATADFLRKQINEKGIIDVGTGVEKELGISREKLNQALYILQLEGYEVYGAGVPQATNPGKQTNIKVICPPGTEHKDIYNFEDVHSLKDYISYDDGQSFKKAFEYPSSMDSKRLQIRYAEDGGINKDGVIELRRYIRGFITPKYENNVVVYPRLNTGKDVKTIAHEVITGLWGSGNTRKNLGNNCR